MLRVKAKERKQRAMEAKVEDSERKLAEFNARLTVRKNKVRSISGQHFRQYAAQLVLLQISSKASQL